MKNYGPKKAESENITMSTCFRFRFWQFGSWVEVCVDDKLPSCRGRPIGLSCADPTMGEFWPALLEKAYAK